MHAFRNVVRSIVGQFYTEASWLATRSPLVFCQIYFSRERRGAAAEPDARGALARLEKAGAEAKIDNLGDPTMLPQEVELARRSDIARTFGSGFAERIETIPPGAWSDPVASGCGLHLVLVRERIEAKVTFLCV